MTIAKEIYSMCKTETLYRHFSYWLSPLFNHHKLTITILQICTLIRDIPRLREGFYFLVYVLISLFQRGVERVCCPGPAG